MSYALGSETTGDIDALIMRRRPLPPAGQEEAGA